MYKTISNEKGLTLIELCLTIIILGLMVMAVTPNIAGNYYDLQIKSSAERIADELKMAMAQSGYSKSPCRLRINEDGRIYFLELADDFAASSSGAPLTNLSWKQYKKIILDEGMHLSCEQTIIPCSPITGWQQNRLLLQGRKNKKYSINLNKREIHVEKAAS